MPRNQYSSLNTTRKQFLFTPARGARVMKMACFYTGESILYYLMSEDEFFYKLTMEISPLLLEENTTTKVDLYDV
jgi:hypothetical protein